MKIPAEDISIDSMIVGELHYVRIEHIPTGIIVADSFTTEYEAKELAYNKLVNKLKQIKYAND